MGQSLSSLNSQTGMDSAHGWRSVFWRQQIHFAFLFVQGDKVNYDRFRNWLLQDKEAFTLSRWLLSGGVCVTLTDDSDTPTFYQTLAGVTHRKATPKTASCSSAPECYVFTSHLRRSGVHLIPGLF